MTEQQKIDLLMVSRYRMIASYYGAKCDVGDILYKYQPAGWKLPMYITNPGNIILGVSLRHYEVEPYDHLFQKLPWYAERKVNEMPDFVKRAGYVDSFGNPVPDEVFKVGIHFTADSRDWRSATVNCFELPNMPGASMSYAGMEPATLEQYTEYINKNK